MPTNYVKDILGNLSRGMRLAWCTMKLNIEVNHSGQTHVRHNHTVREKF